MSARLTFRLAAAAFALVVVLVAALQTHRPAPVTKPAPTTPSIVRPIDARLARCQALGAAGAQDRDCLQAWDAARTRFLGASRAER